MHHHDLNADELAWLAFRYVAGELNATEREQFELLLAESQGAREAVTSAVELSQAAAIALAARPVTLAKRSSLGVRWAWTAAAAAACVVLVWGAVQWRSSSSGAPSGDTAALAAQWSQVRAEQALELPWDELNDSSAPTIDEAIQFDELDERDAPPWMLAAVLEQRAAQELPGDMERGGDESHEQ